MKSIFDVSDKLIVITGGLGLLGREITQALLQEGAKVIVLDLPSNPSALDENVFYISCDITEKEQIEKCLDTIKKKFQAPPEVLINNAGIDSRPNAPLDENGPFETYPAEVLDRILSVNLKGTIFCCQVFGGEMARCGKGSIINVGSIYGMLSPQHNLYEYRFCEGKEWYKPFAYSVSKSAIYNLTRYLATYWARKGVRVNTLTPAGISSGEQPEEFLNEYQKRIPIGKMAQPKDMIGAIQFLSSQASSYMTGANLIIDGGWSAW